MIRPLFFCVLLLASSLSLIGQSTIIGVSPHYSYQVPFGDLSAKFSNNSNIGVNVNIKLKSNWTISAEGQFIFGSDYKDLTILGYMVTSGGFIIGKDQSIETPAFEGRGGNFFAEMGRIFPLSGKNPNCGVHIKAGVGYMYYKATSNADDLVVLQLSKNYIDGYNRMESGLSINLYGGYTFYGENRFVNGSIGLQLIYFNSKYSSLQTYAFPNPMPNSSFSNFLLGPKVSMTIILKEFKGKTTGDEYFYN